MTDKQLVDLFTVGTAPSHDPAFTLAVAIEISRARLHKRMLALALRATVMLMLTVSLFVTFRLLKPLLVQLLEGVLQLAGVPMQLLASLPQFMGVPIPLVLGALVVGLALRSQRFRYTYT
jgi:hypothetical protein